MSKIISYTITGVRYFIVFILIYVCIKSLCSNGSTIASVIDAIMLAIAGAELFFGTAQLLGFFLIRWASMLIRICEWTILFFLAYKLWFEHLILQ